MSYIDYVYLLEKYNGRLRGASNKELRQAKRNNLNPKVALKLARERIATGKPMFMFDDPDRGKVKRSRSR